MRGDDAAIGIGTMIVFVATAIVAAVAAGILISAGSDVQKQEPEDDLQVVQVIGLRDAPTDAQLRGLEVFVLARADMDPATWQVELQAHGEQVAWQAPGQGLVLRAHHDTDGSFQEGLANEGDVVGIRIGLDAAGVALESGDTVSLRVSHGDTIVDIERQIRPFGEALVIPL